MNCCDYNCTQGRDCPVRAARQGMAVHEPTDTTYRANFDHLGQPVHADSVFKLSDLGWLLIAIVVIYCLVTGVLV